VDEEAALLVKPRSGVARASTAGSGRIVSATAAQPGPSAEALAERAQGGCRESFEELVLRHEDRIFNFLHQFTRNRHDAEDLTQETFLKVYQNLHRYKPALAFAPWLFTIARRTAASHFRSAKPFEELSTEGESALESPAESLERKDEQTSIWDLARTLK